MDCFPSFLNWISVHGFELISAIISLICVFLAMRNHISNWPTAILGSFMYAIFFVNSGLYSDAVLNVFFLGFQIYGWIQWYRKHSLGDFSPIRAPIQSCVKLVFCAAIIFFPWCHLMTIGIDYLINIKKLNMVQPRFLYQDAALFLLSLVASYMQAKKWIQHWLFWILIDLCYIPIYLGNHNHITAALYLIYALLAFQGYRLWKKMLN